MTVVKDFDIRSLKEYNKEFSMVKKGVIFDRCVCCDKIVKERDIAIVKTSVGEVKEKRLIRLL